MKINMGDIQFKINNAFDLVRAFQSFPERKEEFFRLTLKTPEILRLFTQNISNFKVLIELFPGHREDFFQLTLKTPEILKLFTRNVGFFTGLIELFPGHKEEFFQLTLKTPEILRLFTRNVGFFQRLVKLFSEYKEELIKIVLKRETFSHLIRYNSDLSLLTQMFPDKEVLRKKTIKEIQAVLKSDATIGQVATFIHRNKYGPSSNQRELFERLPDALNKKIAALTGNPDAHDEKESWNIANKNYHS